MKVPEFGIHWPSTQTWAIYICNDWPHCYWGFQPNHRIVRGFSRHICSSLTGIQYYWILKRALQVDQLVNIHNHASQIKRVKGMLNTMILKTLYKQQSPFMSKRRKFPFKPLNSALHSTLFCFFLLLNVLCSSQFCGFHPWSFRFFLWGSMV